MQATSQAYTIENDVRSQTVRSFATVSQPEKSVTYAHSGEAHTFPEVLVDTHFRIRSANRAFCEQFQLSPSVSSGSLLFSLGTAQWEHSAIRTMLNDAIASDSVQECSVPMDLSGVGRCLVRLTAQRQPKSHPLALIAIRIEECTLLRKAVEAAPLTLVNSSEELGLAQSTQLILRGLHRDLALIIGCAQAIINHGDAEQQESAADIMAAAYLIQNAHSALLSQARNVSQQTNEAQEAASKDTVTTRPQLRIEEADLLSSNSLTLGVAKNRSADHLVYA